MNVPRNVFDLSHGKKFSCSMGKLIPVYLEEVLPNDYFRVMTSIVVRFGALLRPIMHKVDVFLHFYWCPTRIVWDDFTKFITGGEDGLDSTAAPYITLAGPTAEGSLADMLGIPIRYTGSPLAPAAYVNPITVSALQFRVYATIWNEHYRNLNHQSKVVVSKGNGSDTTTSTDLLFRNWERDYFTSALNSAQRGAAVTLPLGTTAPVRGIGKYNQNFPSAGSETMYESGSHSGTYGNKAVIDPDAAGSDGLFYVKGTAATGGYPDIYADLSGAASATVNVIRQAFQVQRWQEINQTIFSGNMFIDYLRKHFGAVLEDYKAQRPVFLGGARAPVVVSEVIQTSADSGDQVLGGLAGHAFSVQNELGFRQEFQEHGFIMGLMSIMPRTAYQQGLSRMWKRFSKLDYYVPVFAHLGYRAIPKSEIYCDGDTGDSDTFGYVPPWEEYRFHESSVHGAFRNSMDNFHLGRIFDSRPSLGSAFITADPSDRVFAVTGEDNIYVQVWHDVKAVRPLPLIGEPGMIDH